MGYPGGLAGRSEKTGGQGALRFGAELRELQCRIEIRKGGRGEKSGIQWARVGRWIQENGLQTEVRGRETKQTH